MSSWGYVEVLEQVVARLELTDLPVNVGLWAKGVSRLKKEFPGLLRGVSFVEREPYPPFSEEVSEFLRMFERSLDMKKPNPYFSPLTIERETKQRIKEEIHPALGAKHLTEINRMAEILQTYLLNQAVE